MANVVQFILELKDMMSSRVQSAAESARRSLASVNTAAGRASTSVAGIGAAANTTAARGQRSIAVLERALRMLENKRRLMVDDSALAASSRRAQQLRAELARLNNVGSASAAGGGSAAGGASAAGGGLAGLVKGGAIAYVAKQAVDAAFGAGKAAFGAAMKNIALERAINVTTRGQGAEAISQTRELSNKYGLDYGASLEGVKTLTGGLMGLNIPLKEQMKIVEGVGTGIAALGIDAEATKGAFLALGQMASKGTVSAEELRGQLGERIPGAFGIAARAMNVTEAALGQMMQKGEIVSSVFLPKFAAEMQKTFGDAALKIANGPQGIMNRASNAWERMKQVVGEGVMPLLLPLIQSFTKLAETILPSIVSTMTGLVASVKDIWASLTGVNEATGGWMDYVRLVKDYFVVHVVPAAMKIGSLIWSVVKGVIEWVQNSNILKFAVSSIYFFVGKVLDFIGWIASKLQWILENVIKPILDAVDWAFGKVMGMSNTTIKVKAEAPSADAFFAPGSVLAGFRGKNLMPGGAKSNTAFSAVPAQPETSAFQSSGLSGAAAGAGAGKTKKALSSKGVTQSGPKVITINFNKEFIGELAINTSNIKQGIGEMEGMVKEAVYRIFYSLETQNG